MQSKELVMNKDINGIKKNRITRERISILIVALISGLTCVISLLNPSLYQDNAFTKQAWFGNDLITILVAVPLLLVTGLLIKKTSHLLRLLSLGGMWYMVYNYVFYVYGTSFNTLFLAYILLVVLSGRHLIKTLIVENRALLEINQGHAFGKLEKFMGIYLLVFAGILGILWIMLPLLSIISGQIPEHVVLTGHVTAIVFATDLMLLIPVTGLVGLLLVKKSQWSIVGSLIVLTKCSAYSLVLLTMHLVQVLSGESGDPFLGLWIVLGAIAIGGQVAMILKYRKVGS